MLGIIETPFGFLDTYFFCINAGIFVTLIVQIAMLVRKVKWKKAIMFIACYYVLLWLGQFASAFVRCANDGALDGKMNLLRGVLEQAGTHFLGHVLMYSLFLIPLLWIVSSLFMEPEMEGLLKGANILFICLPIQHIFNRLGCFCRGCCYGIPYGGVMGISFPQNEDIIYDKVFPTQLFEIGCMLVLLCFAVMKYRKGENILGIIMIGFAVTFFVSEFLTCNPYAVRHLGLTYVQYFSIFELFLGILITKIYVKKTNSNNEKEDKDEK